MNREQMKHMVNEIGEKTIGTARRVDLALKLEGLAEKVRKAANIEDCIWTFGSTDKRCPVDLYRISRERSGLLPNEAARLCWGIKKIADQLYSDYMKQLQIEDRCYKEALEEKLFIAACTPDKD